MKKKILIAFAIVLTIAGLNDHLSAQEATEVQKTKTKSNQSNDRSTDQNTVVCIGKIRCTDGSCTINFDQEIVSPRDAASGLPTGKRQHKPFTMTKELDSNTSSAVRESPTKASTGKVSYSDLSVMVTSNGKSKKLPVANNQVTLPDDCDDDCDLVVSWSWGESNAGTSKRYQATFNLGVEDGAFMASKHTKTGHVTLMK